MPAPRASCTDGSSCSAEPNLRPSRVAARSLASPSVTAWVREVRQETGCRDRGHRAARPSPWPSAADDLLRRRGPPVIQRLPDRQRCRGSLQAPLKPPNYATSNHQNSMICLYTPRSVSDWHASSSPPAGSRIGEICRSSAGSPSHPSDPVWNSRSAASSRVRALRIASMGSFAPAYTAPKRRPS